MIYWWFLCVLSEYYFFCVENKHAIRHKAQPEPDRIAFNGVYDNAERRKDYVRNKY